VLLAAALVTDEPTGGGDGTGGSEGGAEGTAATASPPTGTEPPSGGDTGTPTQESLDAILAGLQAGGFVTFDSAPDLADLAIVVAGPPPTADSSDANDDANAAWVSLASSLDAGGLAAVLSQPSTDDAGDGAAQSPVSALVADPTVAAQVSTVIGVDDPSGQVATVLALTADAAGVTGHYGPGAPDGALPDLTSTGG
jgi:hypothetical protein